MGEHLQEAKGLKGDRDRYVEAEGAVRADIEQSSMGGFLPRSRRFPIETRIYYRKQGNSNWQEGRTLNISQSGVLFGARNVPAPRTTVEMSFSLPVRGGNYRGGLVLCQGEIVRNVPATGSSDLPQAAATIVTYRLARKTTRGEQ